MCWLAVLPLVTCPVWRCESPLYHAALCRVALCVVLSGRRLASPPPQPLPSLFWAAGFSFSRSALWREVSYDPLPHLFFGEETVMAAKYWLAGWDFFTPNAPIVFHLWSRAASGRPTFRYVAAWEGGMLVGAEAYTTGSMLPLQLGQCKPRRLRECGRGFSVWTLHTAAVADHAVRVPPHQVTPPHPMPGERGKGFCMCVGWTSWRAQLLTPPGVAVCPLQPSSPTTRRERLR